MSVKPFLLIIVIGGLCLSACVPGGRSTPLAPQATSPVPKGTQTNPSATPATPPTRTAAPSPTQTSVPDTPTPEPSLTSPPATSSIPADWLFYNNRDHGFELLYPPGSTLVEDQTEHARIDLPFQPDTTLQEKYLEIELIPTQDEDTCSSPFASGYAPEAVRREMVDIDGKSFMRESGSEGAAGSTYEWVAYLTVRGKECVSLTFILHSTEAANYEVPPPEFDAQTEKAVFEQIVSTFQWLE